MINVWFLVFCVECGWGMLLLFLKPRRAYEFPYFMGAAFSTFILPQLYGLSLARPTGDPMFSDVCIMAVLCYAACFIGYALGVPRGGKSWVRPILVAPARVMKVALVFAAGSFFFSVLIYRLPAEVKDGLWTGTVTKYGFFAGVWGLAFPLSLFLALTYRRKAGWAAAFLSAVWPAWAVVFYGRRELAVRLVVSTGIVLFLARRKVVPRWMLVAGMFAVLAGNAAVGEYRRWARSDLTAAVRTLDMVELWEKLKEGNSGSEVQNAMHLIAATKVRGDYGLGRGYWNQVVFAFVPAQYLGMEFKHSLMLGKGPIDEVVGAMQEGAAYQPLVGSTVTGLGDSFHEFGYAGPLVFVALGWLFRRLWGVMRYSRSMVLGTLYACLVPSAMKAVTHWTLGFLPELIYFTLFAGLAVWYSNRPWYRVRRLRCGAVRGCAGRRLPRLYGDTPGAIQALAGRVRAVAG
jgi:hypothetical protein